MKRMLFTALVLCLAATATFAQKKIKDTGYVKYEITEIQSDDGMAGMLKGSTMETFIGKEQSRVSLNMLGGMMMIDTYTEGDGSTVMLMNMMGSKMKTAVSAEEAKKLEKEQGTQPKMEYTYNKKKTKMIAGYKCHQVVAKSDDGTTMTLYVTKKIALKPASGQSTSSSLQGVEGFPLEFTVSQEGMTITFSAKEVKGQVSKSAFKYDDTGYEEIEASELGGGMGGFGL